MKPLLTVVATWLLTLAPLGAQEPLARSSLDADKDPWVGQRITLVIELLAPGFFDGTPTFDLPSVSGLLLLPSQGSPLVGSEQIDGATYTSQRWEFPVFAQRAGTFEITKIPIRFAYKKNPLDHDAVPVSVTAPGQRITAKLPPGADAGQTLLSATDFKAEETWSPEPQGKAKLGDAFTRKITFSATDVPSMAFPQFPAPAIPGLGVYRKTPKVLDTSNRGTTVGQREETIVYVCESGGTFEIPTFHFNWWNSRSNQMETVDFPARKIEVPSPPIRLSNRQILLYTATIVGSLVLAFLSRRWLKIRIIRTIAVFRPIHLSKLNPN